MKIRMLKRDKKPYMVGVSGDPYERSKPFENFVFYYNTYLRDVDVYFKTDMIIQSFFEK